MRTLKTFKDFQLIAREQHAIELFKKERELVGSRESLLKAREIFDEAQVKHNQKEAEVRNFRSNVDIYAKELLKSYLKAAHMPDESEVIFEKFYVMASELAEDNDDIEYQLEELLAFYNDVDEEKKSHIPLI